MGEDGLFFSLFAFLFFFFFHFFRFSPPLAPDLSGELACPALFFRIFCDDFVGAKDAKRWIYHKTLYGKARMSWPGRSNGMDLSCFQSSRQGGE